MARASKVLRPGARISSGPLAVEIEGKADDGEKDEADDLGPQQGAGHRVEAGGEDEHVQLVRRA